MPKVKSTKNMKKRANGKKSRNKNGAVSIPLALGSSSRSSRAPIMTTIGLNCRVRHREFITIISGAEEGSFHRSFMTSINAGNAALFPWLATIASRYESFRFSSLKFEYKPLCATTQPGLLALVVDPDVSDPVPNSLAEALNYGIKSQSNVWSPCNLQVPSGALNRTVTAHFVDTTGSGSGTGLGDSHMYNAGRFFVFFQGTNTDGGLGTLEVDYDIILQTPEMHPGESLFRSTEATQFPRYRPFGNSNPNPQGDGTYRSTVTTFGNSGLKILQGYDGGATNPTHQVLMANAPFDGILEYFSKGLGEAVYLPPLPEGGMNQQLLVYGNDSTADRFEIIDETFNVVTPTIDHTPPDQLFSFYKGRFNITLQAGQFVRLINRVGERVVSAFIQFAIFPLMREVVMKLNDPLLNFESVQILDISNPLGSKCRRRYGEEVEKGVFAPSRAFIPEPARDGRILADDCGRRPILEKPELADPKGGAASSSSTSRPAPRPELIRQDGRGELSNARRVY